MEITQTIQIPCHVHSQPPAPAQPAPAFSASLGAQWRQELCIPALRRQVLELGLHTYAVSSTLKDEAGNWVSWTTVSAHLTIPSSSHFIVITDAQTKAHFGLCFSTEAFSTQMSEHLILLCPGPSCRPHEEGHTSTLVISVLPSTRGVPGLQDIFSVPSTGDILGDWTNHTPTKSPVKRREEWWN